MLSLDEKQLELDSGNFLFPDRCGAQCNVILLELYKKAMKGYQFKNVTAVNTKITIFGGSKWNKVGQVMCVCGVTVFTAN